MELRHSGHSVYKTEYHITWITKYRRRILNPGVSEYLNRLFPKLLKQIPGVEIIEKNILVDHIHLVMVLPPKYAVSSVIGFIKGKSAIAIARTFLGKERNFNGANFWARGYAISTVGFNLEEVKKYIKEQEENDNDFIAPTPVIPGAK